MAFYHRRREESKNNLHLRFLAVVLVMFSLLPLYVILLSDDGGSGHCSHKLSDRKRQLLLHVRDILEGYRPEDWVSDLQNGQIDFEDPEIREAIENLVFAFRNYTMRRKENTTESAVRTNLPSSNNGGNYFNIYAPLKEYDKKFDNYYLLTLNNPFGVHFTGKVHEQPQSAHEIQCDFKKRAPYETLSKRTKPFRDMGIDHLFPGEYITELYGERLGTCAVVASAAFFNGSKLGKEIDSHDAVLRYNDAPTGGYETDVGSKTTIRLLNTKVFTNDAFENSEIYRNTTLVIWKSGPYNGNLYRFYTAYGDAKTFFDKYSQRREKGLWDHIYVLEPTQIWRTWDIMQENIKNVTLRKTIPSSGIIGIMLMQRLCDTVNVYGYIVPGNFTLMCHYYDKRCSWGRWHPVEFEKSVVRRMNVGKEEEITKKARISLPGLRSLKCD
ncbi:beta-galactoside alpha-2,6-sialyltransferase 2-like [Ptychodera flava]|uniref:beta-galactoside alpha-2,6-sialyltransferase 2-like n=1 Tax=Ptychodera flava TaxID=63121 RepID=UPI003969BE7B